METTVRISSHGPRLTKLRRVESGRAAPEYAVFTAVEGTMLDFDTLDGRAARGIVGELHGAGVPVVPVTGMTLEEAAPVAGEYGLRNSMIVEAGGAIARWRAGAWTLDPVGPPSETLLDAIGAIEALSGADLSVYSALPDIDSARLSGRHGAMLGASTRREFSEPFVIERGDVAAVRAAAAGLGFAVVRGKRFYNLVRAGEEAAAFERVRDQVRCRTVIAVGGSPIDAAFLRRADIPVIVPRPDGRPDRELLGLVPGAMIAPAPGAAGWTIAVGQVWSALQSAERTAVVA